MNIDLYHSPSELSADIKEMSSLIKQYNKSISLLKKIEKADHLDFSHKVEMFRKVRINLASAISGIMSRGAALGQGDLQDHDQMGEALSQQILSKITE